MTWKLYEDEGDEWELQDGSVEWGDEGVEFRPIAQNGQKVDATWITVWIPHHKISRMVETL